MSDYIKKCEIPEGVEKRDTHLYGVTGIFEFPPEIPCVAFGGYFRRDILENLVIDGQFIDFWGSSGVEGTMTETELFLEKNYDSENSRPIAIKMRKEGNLWIGEYEIFGLNKIHKIQARLSLVDEDAFGIVCGKPYFR